MTAENPEDYDAGPDPEDVDAVLEEIEAEAGKHGGDYAAGLRMARTIVESGLE